MRAAASFMWAQGQGCLSFKVQVWVQRKNPPNASAAKGTAVARAAVGLCDTKTCSTHGGNTQSSLFSCSFPSLWAEDQGKSTGKPLGVCRGEMGRAGQECDLSFTSRESTAVTAVPWVNPVPRPPPVCAASKVTGSQPGPEPPQGSSNPEHQPWVQSRAPWAYHLCHCGRNRARAELWGPGARDRDQGSAGAQPPSQAAGAGWAEEVPGHPSDVLLATEARLGLSRDTKRQLSDVSDSKSSQGVRAHVRKAQLHNSSALSVAGSADPFCQSSQVAGSAGNAGRRAGRSSSSAGLGCARLG